MKLSFDLENYWKPGIAIIAFSSFILWIEPGGTLNLILIALSCFSSAAIYKHLYTKKMIPVVSNTEPLANAIVQTAADALKPKKKQKQEKISEPMKEVKSAIITPTATEEITNGG